MDFVTVQQVEQDYISPALESMKIKIVQNEEDYATNQGFHPKYLHQIFGEHEQIYGYKNLAITLYFSALSFKLFLNISYEEVVDYKNQDCAVPDDIEAILRPFLPPVYYTAESDFLEHLRKEKEYMPFGDVVREFANEDLLYEIRHISLIDERALSFHKNIQLFTLLFIDCANLIDADDEKWHLFYTIQKKGTQYVSVVGYATVYSFFYFPNSSRLRLSQMVILPPFQGRGQAGQLLRGLYAYAVAADIHDLTVEDPTPQFSLLRCVTDIRLLKQHFFKDGTLPPLTPALEAAVVTKLKLYRPQVQKCLEILQYAAVDKANPAAMKAFRLLVKQRLRKQHTEELEAIEEAVEKKRKLETLWQQTETEYRFILEKV